MRLFNRILSCFLFLSSVFIAKAQLINLPQTFAPKVYLSNDYARHNNFETNSSNLNLSFPLKTKFGVNLDFSKKRNGIEGIEDLLKINFSQKLIGVTARNTLIQTPTFTQTQQKIGASITSINYRKKFQFLYYRLGVNYYHTCQTAVGAVSVNGLIGQMQVINLRNVLFYGAIGVWNYGNHIALPIVGWMHKIDRKSSYSLIFPSSAKFTYKLNRTIKLDAMTYVNTFRNQYIENNSHISSQFSQLRSGIQLRWKLGRATTLNVEGGVEYYSRYKQWKGYEKQLTTTLPTRPFVKASFFYTFGKSLFNSNALDISLE